MGDNPEERIDILLRKRGLVSSRSRGKRYIMAGQVYVDDELCDKPGTQVPEDAEIEIRGDQNPYVSRGGLKLEPALESFGYDPSGKTCIDVGASTGGFTDCLLQHGADHVFAVDVGYGQLAWKLRNDERVTVIERTNIREMEPDRIDVPCGVAVIDCSFISLDLVIPNTLPFLSSDADIIALIKPQFEAGRERVESGGVVSKEDVRREVISETIQEAEDQGLEHIDGIDSPVHGPSGNIEHLVWLKSK